MAIGSRIPKGRYPPLSGEVSVRGLIAYAETGLIILIIIMFFEGPLARLLSTEQSADGNSLLRLIWLPAYAGILAVSLLHLPNLARIIWRTPFLVILLALAAASTAWSIDVALTARRVIAIGFTTLFGLYLAARFSWRDLLRLFGGILIVLAAISFAVSLALPDFGRDFETHGGAWRGLWWEKNTLGAHMARGSFLMGFLALVDQRYRRLWTVGFVLCAALVLLSTSKTSLLGLFLGIGILSLARWMKRGPIAAVSLIWLSVIAAGVFILVLVSDPDLVFGLLGRDAGLTGRTDIWTALFYAIEQRFWLGHGYGSFWGPTSTPAFFVREAVEWDAPTAHNGWLEVWLGLGLAGVILFLFSLWATSARAIASTFTSWTGVFAIGFLAQFLLFAVSESVILQQNAITWVLYCSVAGRLALDARSQREQPNRVNPRLTPAQPARSNSRSR